MAVKYYNRAVFNILANIGNEFLTELTTSKTEDPIEGLRAFTKAYFELVEKNRANIVDFIEFSLDATREDFDQDMYASALELNAQVSRHVASLFDDLAERKGKEQNEKGLLLVTYLSLLDGLVIRYILTKSYQPGVQIFPLTERGLACADLFLKFI